MGFRKAALAVGLIALLPVLPYAWGGYAGHDFPFHASSWLEVRDAWAAGQMFPTWSAKSNFMLGDPRFCFYPPVSLALGGLLTAALPALWAPAAFVWLCFVAAGLAMYFACRSFVAEEDRVWAGALYMLGPYFVLTALVRFAAAELLVQAALPLIALWFYQAMWMPEREWEATLKMGCLLGVCWITDVPASIMLLYGLLPVAGLCAWRRRSPRALLRFVLAEAVGGGLAAFYLAPVWVEQHWISMGALLDDDPRLMLMFVRLRGAAQPNYVLGAWLFAAGGAAIVAGCWWRGARRQEAATWTWVCLAAVGLGLQLPISGVLWRYVPELRAVQFPYRFLPLIWVAVPLVLFGNGTRRSLRWPVCALVGALSCFPVFAYARAQRSPKMRTAPLSLLERGWAAEGYMGKPEYLQPGVSREGISQHLAAATIFGEEPQARCGAALVQSGIILRVLVSDAQGRCDAMLGTYYYPFWAARDEAGNSVPVKKNGQGLLLVELPAGHHTVRVSFHPASAVRSVSAGISLVSLVFAGAGLVWCGRRDSGRVGQNQAARL